MKRVVLFAIAWMCLASVSAEEWPGLPAQAHVYPFYPEAQGARAPVVQIRPGVALYLDRADPGEMATTNSGKDFVTNFTGLRTVDGLQWILDVHDSTPGETLPGDEMWRGDGVQILLRIPQVGSADKQFRLGFAPNRAGKVESFAFYGQPDWTHLEASTEPLPSGYRLRVNMPWKSLGLRADQIPPTFGINVVVGNRNVVDGKAARQEAVWGPGGVEPEDSTEMVQAGLFEAGEPAPFLRPDSYLLKKDQMLGVSLWLYSPGPMPSAAWGLEGVFAENKRLPIGHGDATALQAGHTAHLAFPPIDVKDIETGAFQLEASSGKLHTTAGPIRVLSESFGQQAFATQLEEVKQHLAAVRRQVAEKPEFAGDSYVKLGLATVDLFVYRLENPGAWNYEPQPFEWSEYQVAQLPGILEEVERRLREDRPATVARPAAGERPVIKDGLFWSRAAGPEGKGTGDPRIFYYYGFGHFDRVERDIPLLGNFGISLIQQDRRPESLNPDGSFQEKGNNAFARNARPIREVLQDAAANGIQADLLLSTGSQPRWFLDQQPGLKLKASESFRSLPYNIDDPAGRKMIARWLETILPTVRDSPALFSLCLSNEPIYKSSGRDAFSRPLWEQWLKKRHETVRALNALYGTSYKNLAEVPVPAPAMPERLEERRAYYDWVIFNQQNLAEWHRWMNDIARREAPGAPTHSKLMADIMRGNQYLDRGVDPELFCAFTDLAGNDCWTTTTPSSEFSYRWQHPEMWYDLLHSFRGQPVFNSENHTNQGHLPPPKNVVAPGETYTALWQGALHHQAATTLWIWDQLQPPRKEMVNSLLTRPPNLFAACKAMLDVNRLAPEVAAISKAPARIAFVYSMPTLFWQPEFLPAMNAAYASLTFLGEPVTFLSERQLASGERSSANRDVEWIILARNTHLSDAAFAGLLEFQKNGGKILRIGTEAGFFDEYGRKRQLPATWSKLPELAWSNEEKTATDLFLRLAQWLEKQGMRDKIRVVDAATGKPVWGVQYRTLSRDGGSLLSVVNLLAAGKHVDVRIEGAGNQALDLISGRKIGMKELPLKPVTPMLLEIRK